MNHRQRMRWKISSWSKTERAREFKGIKNPKKMEPQNPEYKDYAEKAKKTGKSWDYMSETAKERPVKGWGAFGGAGWGGGRSCSRSTKAPKSSFTAFLSFLVMRRMPARPNPSKTHRFADGEDMLLSLSVISLSRAFCSKRMETKSLWMMFLCCFVAICLKRRWGGEIRWERWFSPNRMKFTPKKKLLQTNTWAKKKIGWGHTLCVWEIAGPTWMDGRWKPSW